MFRNEASLTEFFSTLEASAEQGFIKFEQLSRRAFKQPPTTFLRKVVELLELEQVTVALGLTLLRRVVEQGVMVRKGMIHRILLVCLILAEKFTQDSENNIESYSLVSGVPIKDIILLELKIFELMQFNICHEDSQKERLTEVVLA